jgi:hypothetical protein
VQGDGAYFAVFLNQDLNVHGDFKRVDGDNRDENICFCDRVVKLLKEVDRQKINLFAEDNDYANVEKFIKRGCLAVSYNKAIIIIQKKNFFFIKLRFTFLKENFITFKCDFLIT